MMIKHAFHHPGQYMILCVNKFRVLVQCFKKKKKLIAIYQIASILQNSEN
jgi:hypothetical protein